MSQITSFSGSGGGGSGTLTLNYITTGSSTYVVQPTDTYIGCQTNITAITVQLPDAPVTGRIYIVSDIFGAAIINSITVTTVSGGVLIDGANTYVMNSAYQAAQFLFNGTKYLIF